MANKQVIQKSLNVFFKFNNKAHSHNEISIPSPTELTTGDSTTTTSSITTVTITGDCSDCSDKNEAAATATAAEDHKIPKVAEVG